MDRYLILCDSWDDATKLFQDFGTLMTIAKALSCAKNYIRTIELKDGSTYRFLGMTDKEKAAQGFTGTVISGDKFRKVMDIWVKRSVMGNA